MRFYLRGEHRHSLAFLTQSRTRGEKHGGKDTGWRGASVIMVWIHAARIGDWLAYLPFLSLFFFFFLLAVFWSSIDFCRLVRHFYFFFFTFCLSVSLFSEYWKILPPFSITFLSLSLFLYLPLSSQNLSIVVDNFTLVWQQITNFEGPTSYVFISFLRIQCESGSSLANLRWFRHDLDDRVV